MSYETLLFAVRDGVAVLTINRPDKLNALNDQVVDELADAAARVATEDAIKGAILTGAGTKAFVAGADIADLSKQGPFDGKARALRGQAMLRRLETCGKPVIAAVNGYALGGGCELAMACHLRIASEHAKFGQPEVKLGIAPGYGGTQRLPRIVGKGNALYLILTADARAVPQQDDRQVAIHPRSGHARGDRPRRRRRRHRLRVGAARTGGSGGCGRPARPRARGSVSRHRAARLGDGDHAPCEGAGTGRGRIPERTGLQRDGGPVSPNDLVSVAMTRTSGYV